MEMDAVDGLGMIKEAIKQDTKDKLYQLYVQLYTSMDKDSYISFESFCKKSAPDRVDKSNKMTYKPRRQNKEQVLSKVQNIMSNYKI